MAVGPECSGSVLDRGIDRVGVTITQEAIEEGGGGERKRGSFACLGLRDLDQLLRFHERDGIEAHDRGQ